MFENGRHETEHDHVVLVDRTAGVVSSHSQDKGEGFSFLNVSVFHSPISFTSPVSTVINGTN